MKSPFNYMSAKAQVAIVLVILFFGYLIAQIIALGLMSSQFGSLQETQKILSGTAVNESDFIYLIWVNVLVQGVWALITYFGVKSFLSKIPVPQLNKVPLMTVCLGVVWILIAIPAVYGIATWIEPLFPENWLNSGMENSSNAFYENLIGSANQALLPVFVSTVIAAPIFEELIFRGTIQPALNNMFRSHHFGIWFSAILFSAIHLQIAGFIPRIILGALLGYLTHWSKSMYPAIFAHATFNAFSLFMSITPGYEAAFNQYIDLLWIPILSIWLGVACYYIILKKSTTLRLTTK
jgi:membrane protease YdiL (CAAX protease family)